MFSKLFKKEWESGEVSGLCQMIIATLQDYWKDIEQWLPEYFSAKFIKECLTASVAQYCMSLRKYPPGTFQFTGELSAARRIFEDMDVFSVFFGSHIDMMKKGGLKLAANDPTGQIALSAELAPMTQLARIISATHFSGAEEEALALFDRWGADGLQLTQCAASCNPNMDKAERNESVEVADRLFMRKKYNSPNQSCDIYRLSDGSYADKRNKKASNNKFKSKGSNKDNSAKDMAMRWMNKTTKKPPLNNSTSSYF